MSLGPSSPRSSRQRRHVSIVAWASTVMLIMSWGCGGEDSGTGPAGDATGSVQVTAQTSGSDLDPDGYTVTTTS